MRGGRGPADRVALVPVAAVDLTEERHVARLDAVTAPWPGQLPAPSPATVLVAPEAVRVVDAAGEAVVVTGRAEVSAAPASVHLPGQPTVQVAAWAGPWPLDERWWDPIHHRRRARFQVVGTDGTAHLLSMEGGRWWREATYD